MTASKVPVIDLSPAATAEGRAAVAHAIREACETIGFFTIVGHGVDDGLIQRTRSSAFAFFALPEEEKMRVRQPESRSSRGYSWPRSRGLAHSLGNRTPADLQESYAMGPIDPVPQDLAGTPGGAAFFAPNYWPERPEGMEAAFVDYYRTMAALARDVLSLFATALGLEPEHFDPFVRQHTSTMRAILYPPIDGPVEPGQLRAGEHTDYGTLTILRGDDVPGGLQVRTRAGEWIDVHPPEDAFVCNIGDLMMRWTNDRWLSNLHRVAVPPEEYRNTSRLSLVFFHNPSADALIECITGVGSGAPRYPAERFGDIYLGKHLKAQTLSAE